MIKRNVRFTVSADGSVMPRIPQYGGVKGEHNATLCGIVLEGTAYEEGDHLRLHFTTGDGTFLSTEHIEEVIPTDNGAYAEYMLPQAVTVGAGQLCMRAVLTRFVDGEEAVVARSGEMVLYFDEATVENGTPFWTGVSQMLERTVTAMDAAVGAQTTATAAAAKAEAARNNAHSYYVGAQEKASDAAHAAENSKNQAATAEQAANEALQRRDETVFVAEFVTRKSNEASGYATRAEQAASRAEEAVNTPGRQGASAYEVAVSQGFEGDEEAWLASLIGPKGDPYTLTDADKAVIVDDVAAVCVAKNQGAGNVGKMLVVGADGNLILADMPEGGANGDVIGALDENNNILLTGNLENGTYTLKYEMADGTYSDVGSIVVGEIVAEPTNLFVVGGEGYLLNGRCSSTGVDRNDSDGLIVSNYIEVKNGDTLYIKNAAFYTSGSGYSGMKLTDGGTIGLFVHNSEYISNYSVAGGVIQFTVNKADAAYIRLCLDVCAGTAITDSDVADKGIIITKNQPLS